MEQFRTEHSREAGYAGIKKYQEKLYWHIHAVW